MKLLTPIALGGKTAKNRIVSTAHAEYLADKGYLTDHIAAYHARRAQGGVGTIIALGSATVSPTAASNENVALWNAGNEPRLRRMADLVHREGALLLAQATHRAGREAPARMDDVLEVPSPLPGSFRQGYYGAPHELSAGEIAAIVERYAEAADRLARCGWDGIQITGLGTHLIEHFWSPVLNRRTDAYGGSFDGRMRFSLEVLRAVDEATPDDFLICFRLSADMATEEVQLDFEEICRIARRLDAEGVVSLFDVSGGSGFDANAHAAAVPPEGYPVGTYLRQAGILRSLLSAPVLAAGRMITPEHAEAALIGGFCDMAGMTRALIADPDLPRAVAEGRRAGIRPCIAINEGCRRVTIGRSLACSVNPGVADPSLMDFAMSAQPRNVTVVGGGPAGMEAARIAAQRGHRVTLVERSRRLGGQMHDFAAISGWSHLLGHVAWLEREIERLDVEVVLGREVSAGEAAARADGVVILATGAETALPPEAGCVRDLALTDVDLLHAAGSLSGKRRVAVVDLEGRLRGAKAALMLRGLGVGEVLLSFAGEFACENLEPTNRPAIYRALAELEVALLPHRHLSIAGREGSLILRNSWTGALEEIDADLFVFAGYRRSRMAGEAAAGGLPGGPLLIGDCRAPRLLRNAVSEGVRAGASI